jgi:predicted lipid-binding transport protein (Tim44 family)
MINYDKLIKYFINFMPRGSSRSSSPTRSSPARAQPAPVRQPAPVQAPAQSGGMFSGFMGTMVSGMAFGAGSEVAHQAVRSMMGTSHSPQVLLFIIVTTNR